MPRRNPCRRLCAVIFVLCASSLIRAAPLSLGELVAAVMRSSPDYLASRAALLPTTSFAAPVALSDGVRQVLSSGAQLSGNYAFTVSPGLSLAQLLPTAGIATASVSDRLTVRGLGGVQPESAAAVYSTDTTYVNQLAFSAGISQPLFLGNAYSAARRIIESTRQTGEIQHASGKNSVVLQAVVEFYALKRLLYSATLIRARLESDRRDVERVEKELTLGRGTQSTLLAARVALLRSETDLLEAELGYDTSFRTFRATYDLDDRIEMDWTVLPFELPDLDEEALVAAAAAGNPSIRGARLARDVREAEMVTARKDNAPTLEIGASLTLDAELGDGEASAQDLSMSVALRAKLGDGGAFRNAMKRREAELAAQEEALRAATIQAEADVRALLDTIRRLGKLRELYLLQEQLATSASEKVAKNRELGAATDEDVRIAQRDLEAARMSTHQNTIDGNLTYLRLLSAEGMDVAEALPEELTQ